MLIEPWCIWFPYMVIPSFSEYRVISKRFVRVVGNSRHPLDLKLRIGGNRKGDAAALYVLRVHQRFGVKLRMIRYPERFCRVIRTCEGLVERSRHQVAEFMRYVPVFSI